MIMVTAACTRRRPCTCDTPPVLIRHPVPAASVFPASSLTAATPCPGYIPGKLKNSEYHTPKLEDVSRDEVCISERWPH